MADKKLFKLLEGTPVDSDKLAFGKDGSSSKNITMANFKSYLTPAGSLKTQDFEIGAWDMYSDPTKFLTLGILPPGGFFITPILASTIRSVSVMILSDTGAITDFLSVQDGDVVTVPQIQITTSFIYIYTTTAYLTIRTNSYFQRDSRYIKTTNPDTTPYNRGWMTITYVDE